MDGSVGRSPGGGENEGRAESDHGRDRAGDDSTSDHDGHDDGEGRVDHDGHDHSDHGEHGGHGHGHHDEHGGHGGHGHGHGEHGSTRTLAAVAAINLVGFLAEFAGGLLFGSVALLSDAVHMLFDALAYVMAFAASYVAENYETSERWSYGLHRLEPLSAFLNGALLLPMVAYILYEAYGRFLDPVAIAGGPTLAIAFGGLLVNLASIYVIEGDDLSLNERGAFYHLLGDAGGSVAVIVAVLVVEYTGIRVIDPIVAGLIALVIVWSAFKLLAGSAGIFLQRTPFDAEAIEAALLEVDGVDGIDDLHGWQICSQLTLATVHVNTAVGTLEESEALTRRVHEILGEYGVDHATVELCPGERTGKTHLDAHVH